MFESLTNRLGDVFGKLRKRGTLTEADVTAALREIRIALLEADVALPVAKDLVGRVKERAIGTEVLRSVTPGQQVVKIVNDVMVEVLSGIPADAPEEERQAQMPTLGGPTLDIKAEPPAAVMMLGLQGSGKTTTGAKIGLRMTKTDKKKVLLASLDTRRPAAQEQLRVLGEQTGVPTLPIIAGQDPVTIAKRAMETGRLEGYDIVILDTAGRLSIDEELMAEVAAVRDAVRPAEQLLVADAMTGQDAVTVATNFQEKVGITGIVLTRVDGDARGGAALSMRAITGKPIKLLGTGEKTDAMEPFHPDRVAGRILGMGDVVSLVEKAAETFDQEQAMKMAAKFQEGRFDLDDFSNQLQQMRKMGGLSGLMGLMPGALQAKAAMAKDGMDDKMLVRQEAIISSMTKQERSNPSIMNASRRRRIAMGSGTKVQDVNRLLKQFQQMQGMMKKLRKGGGKGLMRSLGGMLGGGAGGMIPGMGGGMGDLGKMPPLDPSQMPEGMELPPGMSGLPGMPPMLQQPKSSATKNKNKKKRRK